MGYDYSWCMELKFGDEATKHAAAAALQRFMAKMEAREQDRFGDDLRLTIGPLLMPGESARWDWTEDRSTFDHLIPTLVVLSMFRPLGYAKVEGESRDDDTELQCAGGQITYVTFKKVVDRRVPLLCTQACRRGENALGWIAGECPRHKDALGQVWNMDDKTLIDLARREVRRATER